MAPFNRGGRSGGDRGGRKFGGGGFGGSRFGGKKSFGGRRDGERPQMFSATCSNCGKQCEVPFRPTGEKPVFCNDCFRKERDGGSYTPERKNFDRPRFENRHEGHGDFSLERKGGGASDSAAQFRELKDQMISLNTKMEKILKALTPTQSAPVAAPAPTLAPKAVASPELKKAIKNISTKKPAKKGVAKKAVSKKKR